MTDPRELRNRGETGLCPQSLEAIARRAFSRRVRMYDEQDQIIVQTQSREWRLVYFSARASRQSRSATFIQFRVDFEIRQMWINRLQVSHSLLRQGFGREVVEATEAVARATNLGSIRVDPLQDAVGFWESLGYTPDRRMPRVLQKKLA